MLHRMRCRIPLYGIKHAAYGDADVAKFVVQLAVPAGPGPLAARGLSAVLARTRPGGQWRVVSDGTTAATGTSKSRSLR
jgi:hypothetical protein